MAGWKVVRGKRMRATKVDRCFGLAVTIAHLIWTVVRAQKEDRR